MNEIIISSIIAAVLFVLAIVTHIISKRDWVDIDDRDSWLNPVKSVSLICAICMLVVTISMAIFIPMCPECQSLGTGSYCEECGASFGRTCEECGHEYSHIHTPNYCSNCGKEINK